MCHRFITLPTVVVQSIVINVSACPGLSGCISQRPHLQTSPNSQYTLPVAVTKSCCTSVLVDEVTFALNIQEQGTSSQLLTRRHHRG